MTVKVSVSASVLETENPEKVARAVKNIFPRLTVKLVSRDGENRVEAEGEGKESLERLKRILSSRRIRTAARVVMLQGKSERGITFYLHKQAAFAGQVSFCESSRESPLGPIRVTLGGNNPEEVVEWLTAR